MGQKGFQIAFVVKAFVISLVFFQLFGCDDNSKVVVFGGGTEGGSFQAFALSITAYLNKEMTGVRFRTESSSGSINSITEVDKGNIDMALVNAEDAFLGYTGQLKKLQNTKNIVAVLSVYGSVAQLIVPQRSHYQKPQDLIRHRIAIGNSSSGTAHSAKLFFTDLKMWDQIIPIYMNLSMAMRELQSGAVDAVWIFEKIPNLLIQETSRSYPVRLIPLFDEAAKSGFLAKNFYLVMHFAPVTQN